MSTTITLHIRALRALAKHIAATKDIRFYLNNVLVAPHPDGTIYIATNGHMLATYLDRHDDARPAAPLLFERDSAAKLSLRGLEGLARLEATEVAPDKWLVLRDQLLFTTSAAETLKLYPDHARIFEPLGKIAPEARGTAQINAAYALAMHKCAAEIAGKRINHTYTRLTHFGESHCVLAHTEHDADFLGAIMPVRAIAALESAPAWATVPVPPKKERLQTQPTPQPEEANA